ncbi:MAG: hypothetical protein HOW97_21830 [Catenulispora sp.]|nr:hypothetical protein [Catenulispora sp.]
MDFFCYHRDRAGSLPLRQELLERHWSYMDEFAKQMIARGPVFDEPVGAGTEADGEDEGRAVGSVHIATFTEAAQAWAFAFGEPGYQAGAYRDVMVRRWRNDLERTMWDFEGGKPEGDGYFVLGLGAPLPVGDATVPEEREGLIAYGPLLSDDGETWVGTVALLRADGPEAARAVLDGERYAEIEVHGWEFGGRR